MSYPPPQYPQGYPQPPQPGSVPPPGYPRGPGYPPPGYVPPGAGGPGAPSDKGRKKYNSLTALFVFFLPGLWRDVGQRWWGIGLIYMFLLMLITWVPPFFRGHGFLTKSIAEDAPKLTSQIPTITLNNGDISIDRPEPYTITDPESGQPLVVFDTSGDTAEPPSNFPSVLVTKHGFSIRKSPTEIQTEDLSQVKGLHQYSASDVQGWLDKSVQAWWSVGYPATIAFTWLWRLVLMVVLALIGLAFASGTKAPLTFAGLMRLSAIAMTPVVLIDTVTWTMWYPITGCGWWIIGFIIDLLMLFLAVKANAPKTPAGFSGPQGFPMSPAGFPPPPAPYSSPYPSGSPIPPPPQ